MSAQVKHVTAFTCRWAPALVQRDGDLFLAWADHATGGLRVARTCDLRAFDHEAKLPGSSTCPPQLVNTPAGLLLAWVDAGGGICVAQSPDGSAWSRPLNLRMSAAGTPSLAVRGGAIWLLHRQPDDGSLALASSPDGRAWHDEHVLDVGPALDPCLVVHEDRLAATWVDPASGALLLRWVDHSARARVVHPGPFTGASVCSHGHALQVCWADAARDQVLVARGSDRQRAAPYVVLHERCEGSPRLAEVPGGLVVTWVVRHPRGEIRVAQLRDGDTAAAHVFRGDVQGHPTVVRATHHTDYAYLGIIALASDMAMPKGQDGAGLVAGLDAALGQVRDFWAEASHGHVDVSHQMHPQVVTLPDPIGAYLVRARPKIIDANGASYPIAFAGGETLSIAASHGYHVTASFPAGPHSLDAVVAVLNQAIKGTAFGGPDQEAPLADENENGQLRIRTVWQVDPGNALRIEGGTAVDLLGLGANDVTVYEGSKQPETADYHRLVHDAVRGVLAGKSDPGAFLRQFSGVDVCLASNLGWWLLRAHATSGIPEQFDLVEGQAPFLLHFFVCTRFEGADVHAHETGHNLGLPDLYEEGWRFVGAEPGLWDVMDANSFSHPTAWIKSYCSNVATPDARWMSGADIAQLDPTVRSIEVLLLPSETPFPATNPFATSHPGIPLCHAIKIPLDTNHAFFVENRQRGPCSDPALGDVEFSTHLPGDGLLVTDAVDDLSVPQLPRSNVVLVHPTDLDVADIPDEVIDMVLAAPTSQAKALLLAPYVPSQIPQPVADEIIAAKTHHEIEEVIRAFRDQQVRSFYPIDQVGEEVVLHQFPDGNDIRVQLRELVGAARPQVCLVRARWGHPGSWFDLEIRRWENPPPWQSDDIWIDSEENGWDTYEHHDAAANPDIPGHPILNGDRPWVRHENRVYARVWNHGDIPVNNVRVDFTIAVPPGQSPGVPFDTDYVDIPAGGWAVAKGRWAPLDVPADEHACIGVTVEYQPWDLAANVVGERNADNNSAQENIGDFYVERASPYRDVVAPFQFANPLPDRVEMKLAARGLTPGWTLTVQPYHFWLEPGEMVEGEATLHADDTVPSEDPQEGRPAPLISLDALVQTGCSWVPIGGFTMCAHAVRRSTLEAVVDPAGDGIHVTAHASTADGPISGANVAIRLIGSEGQTLTVIRSTTDQHGHAHGFVPTEPAAISPAAPPEVEVRLSPTRSTGPAAARIPVRR